LRKLGTEAIEFGDRERLALSEGDHRLAISLGIHVRCRFKSYAASSPLASQAVLNSTRPFEFEVSNNF
jgi:hypothetical protein